MNPTYPIFWHCRACLEEDERGAFLSMVDLGVAIKKLLLSKHGITYHHYMFEKRKALVCTRCLEVLNGDPTDAALENLCEQLKKHQAEKFAIPEQRFFKWKQPVLVFEPRRADSFASTPPRKHEDIEAGIRERNGSLVRELVARKLERERPAPRVPMVTRSQATKQQPGIVLRSASVGLSSRGPRTAVVKRFKCHRCESLFVSKAARDNHVTVAHEMPKKKYFCKKCLSRFACPKETGVHVRSCKGPKRQNPPPAARNGPSTSRQHTVASSRPRIAQNPVPAPTRNRSSTQQTQRKYCHLCHKSICHLERHIREVHLKVRPHKCPLCGKGFYRYYEMQKHKLRHGGIHRCIVCKKIFSQKSTLRQHYRSCHHIRYYK